MSTMEGTRYQEEKKEERSSSSESNDSISGAETKTGSNVPFESNYKGIPTNIAVDTKIIATSTRDHLDDGPNRSCQVQSGFHGTSPSMGIPLMTSPSSMTYSESIEMEVVDEKMPSYMTERSSNEESKVPPSVLKEKEAEEASNGTKLSATTAATTTKGRPTLKQQQKTPSRRRMMPVSRLPSKRNLCRSNSIRSMASASVFSSVSRKSINSSPAVGDEMASAIMSDFSESYFNEDATQDDDISSIETEDEENHHELQDEEPDDEAAVIAIGIISPNPSSSSDEAFLSSPSNEFGPKEEPIDTVQDQDHERLSQAYARNIAEEEHNLKLRRKELGTRRRSAPIIRSMKPSTIPNPKSRSLQGPIGPPELPPKSSNDFWAIDEPFLETAQSDFIQGSPINTAPIFASRSEEGHSPSHARITSAPTRPNTNRTRRVSYRSSTSNSSTPDRQEKIRLAMGVMGSAASNEDDCHDGTKVDAMFVTPRQRNRKTTPVASEASPRFIKEETGGGLASKPARKPVRSLLPPAPTPKPSSKKSPQVVSDTPRTYRSSNARDDGRNEATEETNNDGLKRQMSVRSVASNSSGIDLDEKTRNDIISRSAMFRSRRMRNPKRQSSQDTNDEKRLERDRWLSSRSLGSSRGSSGKRRPSKQKTEDASKTSKEARRSTIRGSYRVPAASSPGTSSRAYAAGGRPCDEKRDCKISTFPSYSTANSGSSTPSRHRTRPSDEKAEFRRSCSSNLSIAATVSSANATASPGLSRQRTGATGSKAELSPSGHEHQSISRILTSEEEQLHQDERIAPNHQADDHEASDSNVATSADSAAEGQNSGTFTLVPGAFAISSRNQDDSAYESEYESESENEESPESEPISEMEEDIESPQGQTEYFRPEVPDLPVQAELYEEHYAVTAAQIIDDSDPENEKVKEQSRLFSFSFAILFLSAILGTVLLVLRPGNIETKSVGSNETGALIEGWVSLESSLMGPTDMDGYKFGFAIVLSADSHRMAVGLPGYGKDELRSMGAVFVLDFNGTDYIKSHQIEGPGMGAKAGSAIAISDDGKRIAIGSPAWEANGGHAAIYEENDIGAWELLWELTGDKTNGTALGSSLGLSSNGTTFAIGDKFSDQERGSITIFEESENNTWSQMGNPIVGERENDVFGWALALSGNGKRIAASALRSNDAGSLQVFDFEGEDWEQKGSTLIGESQRDNFGTSIALSRDGETVAVGSSSYSIEDIGIGVGRAEVYGFDGTSQNWTPKGPPIDGAGKFDSFGTSIALSSDGDRIAIGGPNNDKFGENAGNVRIFEYHQDDFEWGSVGSQLGALVEGGQLGFSVALSGDGERVACGAPFTIFDRLKNDVGQVFVFDAIE